MTTSLKSQTIATARAYESLLSTPMSFGSRVQARRVYMEKLEMLKSKTESHEAKSLIGLALKDVSDHQTVDFALRASEVI